MDALFLKVLNMSLAASGLILAVMVLRAVLRKAPRWMLCSLWALAALRLLCPFTPESSLSLVPREEIIQTEVLYVEPNDPAESPAVSPAAPAEKVPAAEVPAPRQDRVQTWTVYGAILWLSGAGGLTLYALGSFFLLRRRVRPSLAQGDGVWICDGIDTPFILGVFRPGIYLPSAMDDAQKVHVLAHERAHLERRDNWWKPLGFIVLAVHWFNPLCWAAYVLFCRDMELAADEKVIRSMEKADRVAYSKTLLACSTPRMSVCPLAFGEVGVKERIRSILHYKKPGVVLVMLSIAAALVLTACFMTSREEKAEKCAIEGHDWIFELVQDKDGYVVYRGADSAYPDGQELDVTLKAKRGVITLKSGEDSWDIPYETMGENAECTIYTLNGGDPASGKSDMAVVSRTIYGSGRYNYTLILSVEKWSLQFRAEGGEAQGDSEPEGGESVFNAKVLRVYDNGFLVEPYPGRERQTAMEFLISDEVLSTNPVPKVQVGDSLRIVYNGGIMESYPARLGTVFAIYPLSDVEKKVEIRGSFPVSGYPAAVIKRFAGDDGKLSEAGLTLLDSGQFTMSFAPFSSYFGTGTYEMEGSELTLHFVDGNVMSFAMAGDTFTVTSDPAGYSNLGPKKLPTVVMSYGGEDDAHPLYEELSDGTWRWGGYIYRYRLVLTDRMPNTQKDSTFVVLSNRVDITFQEAFMACGFSSNLDDYFDPEDARIVQWK